MSDNHVMDEPPHGMTRPQKARQPDAAWIRAARAATANLLGTMGLDPKAATMPNVRVELNGHRA